jgi:hypothetical protein
VLTDNAEVDDIECAQSTTFTFVEAVSLQPILTRRSIFFERDNRQCRDIAAHVVVPPTDHPLRAQHAVEPWPGLISRRGS